MLCFLSSSKILALSSVISIGASFTAITASGNITASGLLFASASSAPTHTDSILAVVYDTSSGQFYYTGSYGSGGGNTFKAALKTAKATVKKSNE